MLKVFVAAVALLALSQAPALAASHGHTHADGAGHASDSAASQGHWTAPVEAQQAVNPIHPDAASIAIGGTLYQENCAACHGATGRGDGELAADLETAPADLLAMAPNHPPGDFAWKIANGRGEMPPWQGALSDDDIWHVVNFIKNLPGNGDAVPMQMPGTTHGATGHGHGG